MKHNNEKYALEEAALTIFLEIFNNNNENKLSIHSRQERPDVLLYNSDRTISGLEITHLFYDSQKARMLLGRSKDRFHGLETLYNSIETLNELLKQKERIYKDIEFTYNISLLVRSASPIYGMTDLLKYNELIHKPSFFKNIWFLSRDGYSEWLMRDLLKV